MTRRTMTVSWDDDNDTPQECLDSLVKDEWAVMDLLQLADDVRLAIAIQDDDGETAIWGGPKA